MTTEINTLKKKLLSDESELALAQHFISQFLNDDTFRTESEYYLHPILESAMMDIFLSHYSEDADDVAGHIMRYKNSTLFYGVIDSEELFSTFFYFDDIKIGLAALTTHDAPSTTSCTRFRISHHAEAADLPTELPSNITLH